MQRVEANLDWSLFCPNEAPGLCDVWGDDFNALYTSCEAEGRARKTVRAQDLWYERANAGGAHVWSLTVARARRNVILQSQMDTGTPYMLYKDACNAKSNQQNLGTIRGSNLCTEIIEYTSADEVAVCNLASVSLPKFASSRLKAFHYSQLYDTIYHMTNNLNLIIDANYYPVREARTSNMRHRPIGLGVQGLADVFLKVLLRRPSNPRPIFL